MALIKPADIIPSKTSSGQEWLDWYKLLKTRYGRKNANTVFSLAWNQRGEYSANTKPLRDYLEKNGVDIEGSNPAIIIEDFVGDATDFVTGTFNTGKTIALVGISLVGLAVVGIVYSLVKNPDNTKELATLIASRGMIKK